MGGERKSPTDQEWRDAGAANPDDHDVAEGLGTDEDQQWSKKGSRSPDDRPEAEREEGEKR